MAIISTTISRCRACNSQDLIEILDLGDQPLANDLRDTLDQEQVQIPLKICRCRDCFTIELTETIDPVVLFSYYLLTTFTS